MEVLPIAYYESLKRYWRRRKYQRLYGTNGSPRRKLKITRLGGGRRHGQQGKIRTASKSRLVSPFKLLAKFHDAYIKMVISIFVGSKKIGKDHLVSLVSTGEEVDTRLVMEIYREFAASRQGNLGVF